MATGQKDWGVWWVVGQIDEDLEAVPCNNFRIQLQRCFCQVKERPSKLIQNGHLSLHEEQVYFILHGKPILDLFQSCNLIFWRIQSKLNEASQVHDLRYHAFHDLFATLNWRIWGQLWWWGSNLCLQLCFRELHPLRRNDWFALSLSEWDCELLPGYQWVSNICLHALPSAELLLTAGLLLCLRLHFVLSILSCF